MPTGVLSVSPWITSTFSIGTPSFVGDQLGEGGLVTLAVAVGAGEHLGDAGVGEADLGALP